MLVQDVPFLFNACILPLVASLKEMPEEGFCVKPGPSVVYFHVHLEKGLRESSVYWGFL